jgi:large subunit ribosomal protein L10
MAEEKKDRPEIARKKAQVEEYKKEFSASKNMVIIDLRKLPDRLLQNVRKKLREKGTKIRVAKSAVMTRALEGAGKPKELIDLFERPVAVVLTELSPYELNKFFRENTMDIVAKAGQIAPVDIIVPAGETALPPGPALSELKAAGINAQIRGPKISIVKDSTVVKAGEEIAPVKAKALGTLGFKPFKTNVDVLLAYDGEYIYSPDLLNISAETLVPEFMDSLQAAFNVSVNADVPTEQNITFLLTQAFTQGMNVGINGDIYSPQSIEQLLIQSLRTGMALSDKVPASGASTPTKDESPDAAESAPGAEEAQKPEEPKPEKKAEEPKAEEPKPEAEEKPKAKEKPKVTSRDSTKESEPQDVKPKPEKKEKSPKEEPKPEKKEVEPKAEKKPKAKPKPKEKEKPSDASAEEKKAKAEEKSEAKKE